MRSIHLMVSVVIVVVGCTVVPSKSTMPRAPTALDISAPPEVDWFGQEFYGDPTYTDVLNIVQDPDVATVGDALTKLALRFPRFMSMYTLMYHSRSIQDSSYEHPRAIVFGSTARTIIAFNDSLQDFPVNTTGRRRSGFSAIEMASYDPQTGYEFRELVFQKDRRDLTYPAVSDEDLDTRWSNARVAVSKANISECADCHGYVNAHPIWENYFTWPGAYGSVDDGLFMTNKSNSIDRVFTLAPKRVDPEAAGWASYGRYVKSHPNSRYARLGVLPEGIGKDQCPAEFRYRLIHHGEDLSCESPSGEKYAVDDPPLRPNFALQKRLASQTMLLVTRQAAAKGSPAAVRNLIKQMNCPPDDSKAPEGRRAIYAQAFDVLDRIKEDFQASLDFRHLNSPGGPLSLAEIQAQRDFFKLGDELRALFPERSEWDRQAVSQMLIKPQDQYVDAFYRAGVDLSEWSIGLKPAPYINTGSETYRLWTAYLIRFMSAKDPQGDWQNLSCF